MRYLLLIFLSFSASFADLQSKIYSSAQDACYFKNPNNGLFPADYNPIVTSQTLRHVYESQHVETQSSAACEQWELDPYVNVDTETYQVIADMDCTVNQETVTNGEFTTTYYWTVTNQYALDVDCNINTECEIPKDSSGVNYESAYGVDESGCTVSNLQYLSDANYPDGYIIDDAQYVTCPSNNSISGCYYKKHVNSGSDNNTTDSNSTDGDITLPGSGDDGTTGDDTTQNSSNTDYSDVLNQIHTDLSDMKELMTTDRKESEISDSLEDSSEVLESGISKLTESLNLISNYAFPPIPVFSEVSGDHVFSALIYGRTVTIDLSMFENVKPTFDIFWLLLLWYINIKIYWLIIRDLFKKL